jgi:hypothetical protein
MVGRITDWGHRRRIAMQVAVGRHDECMTLLGKRTGCCVGGDGILIRIAVNNANHLDAEPGTGASHE